MAKREGSRELYIEILAAEWEYLNDRVSDLEDAVDDLCDIFSMYAADHRSRFTSHQDVLDEIEAA